MPTKKYSSCSITASEIYYVVCIYSRPLNKFKPPSNFRQSDVVFRGTRVSNQVFIKQDIQADSTKEERNYLSSLFNLRFHTYDFTYTACNFTNHAFRLSSFGIIGIGFIEISQSEISAFFSISVISSLVQKV